MHPTLQIILLVVFLAAVALFEAIEIALLAADRFRLRSVAKSRRSTAELSLDLVQRRDKVLLTLLVGNTLAATAAAALATTLAEDRLGPTVAATIVTTVGLSAIILIFCQVVPKNLARHRADNVVMSVARPLFALDLLFLPVTAVLGGLVGLLLRAVGARRSNIVTRDELRYLVQVAPGEPGPLRQEKRMLQSILDFGHTTAREIMVPMPSVVSIEREASPDMLRAILRRRAYTRVPVFERRVDRIVGVVHIFDVLLDPDRGETMDDYMRSITLVPETKRIDRLMLEMQRRGESLVAVVNEFGSCTGILTMEDIVEEIMGEITDEHEVGVKRIRSLGNGSYIVDGLLDIDDLNDELGLDLPKLRYDTVGGLVMRRLGRIPREGDRFELPGASFEVVEVYPFGVRAVKLTLDRNRAEESR